MEENQTGDLFANQKKNSPRNIRAPMGFGEGGQQENTSYKYKRINTRKEPPSTKKQD